MNQQQLSREIADFAFWQQTQNECDRGYVRSGNRVMRRALEEHEADTMKTREFLVFGCPTGHKWESLRFTDSFHPQQPDCPVCGRQWAYISSSMAESLNCEAPCQ